LEETTKPVDVNDTEATAEIAPPALEETLPQVTEATGNPATVAEETLVEVKGAELVEAKLESPDEA